MAAACVEKDVTLQPDATFVKLKVETGIAMLPLWFFAHTCRSAGTRSRFGMSRRLILGGVTDFRCTLSDQGICERQAQEASKEFTYKLDCMHLNCV
jgi:hypothetical protein